MNSAPAVSVLVAAYKSDRYLQQALADALAQTFTDTEVVVYDDAASKETQALVERFEDPRLSYRANVTRLGAAANHRALLAGARGEFVAILNHDDRWDPRYLATLVAPLSADREIKLAFCNHRVIDEEGRDRPERAARMAKLYGRHRLAAGRQPSLLPLFVKQSVATDVACVFRRDAIDPTGLADIAAPAYDLWLAYLFARSPGEAFFVPAALTAWRDHTANLTSQGEMSWLSGALECWDHAYRDPRFSAFRTPIRKKLALALRTRAARYWRTGDSEKAHCDALRSLSLRWFDPKTAALVCCSLLDLTCRRPASQSIK